MQPPPSAGTLQDLGLDGDPKAAEVVPKNNTSRPQAAKTLTQTLGMSHGAAGAWWWVGGWLPHGRVDIALWTLAS